MIFSRVRCDGSGRRTSTGKGASRHPYLGLLGGAHTMRCVCVCVCVRACARACVCVLCVYEYGEGAGPARKLFVWVTTR